MRLAEAGSLVCASLMLTGCGLGAHVSCASMAASDRARLTDFVQKKYKLPKGAAVEIAQSEYVGSSCFQKITFRAEGAGSNFRLDLIASPDYRFLTRDVMDSRSDPAQDELKKRREVSEKLARVQSPSSGPEKAPVTVTVFSDFQCPFCARMADTMREAFAGQSGQVRVVYRFFPLGMHHWARPAAEAAACAQQQGEAYFWKFHDYIFDRQRDITEANFKSKLPDFLRNAQGLDGAAFMTCVERHGGAKEVQDNVKLGMEIGIRATPTVFVNGAELRVMSPVHLRTVVAEIAADPEAPFPALRPAPTPTRAAAPATGSECAPHANTR